MSIYRISGNILQDNLQRGANLTVQGNLVYIDVVNTRLGVNTSTTTQALTVGGNVAITGLTANGMVYANATNTLRSSSNLTFDGANLALTGNVTATTATIGNINIATSNITSDANLTIASSGNGNITLNADGTGLVVISGTDAFVIPVGNTAQRPATSIQGSLRYNTIIEEVEVYDGGAWVPVGSQFNPISNQIITPDGTNSSYTLNQIATDATIIVSTNGVLQSPSIAYSVVGNIITFAETPQTTDIIDIRYITTLTTINTVTNSSGIGVSVAESGVVTIAQAHSLQLPTYTVTSANALANKAPGQLIYVSNGDSGNPCLAVYASGAWKRVSLGANIA
jgi:hypothetical protein